MIDTSIMFNELRSIRKLHYKARISIEIGITHPIDNTVIIFSVIISFVGLLISSTWLICGGFVATTLGYIIIQFFKHKFISYRELLIFALYNYEPVNQASLSNLHSLMSQLNHSRSHLLVLIEEWMHEESFIIRQEEGEQNREEFILRELTDKILNDIKSEK